MAHLKLVDGRFSSQEAERILSALVKVKTTFHQDKIGAHHEEEDMKHSEKRIKELEENLREILKSIKQKPGLMVDIHAGVEIEEIG